MPMFFWRKRSTDPDRRHSSPEERQRWEELRKVQEEEERAEIERKLQYLELQAEVFARKEM